MILNGSGGYWTLQDSMTVTSTLTITQGALDTSGNNCSGAACSMSVAAGWLNNGGRFVANTSTVTFNGTIAAQNITSRGSPFYNLYINGGSNGYWTMLDSMTVNANLTLNKGTLDTSAASCAGASCNLALTGTWLNSGGLFVTNTSTITLTGNLGGQTITSRGNPFYNFYINGGSSGYWTLMDSMTVLSTMTLTQGTLDSNTSANPGFNIKRNPYFYSDTSIDTPCPWCFYEESPRYFSPLFRQDSFIFVHWPITSWYRNNCIESPH